MNTTDVCNDTQDSGLLKKKSKVKKKRLKDKERLRDEGEESAASLPANPPCEPDASENSRTSKENTSM